MDSEIGRREFVKMSAAGLTAAGAVGFAGSTAARAAEGQVFKLGLGYGMIRVDGMSVMDKFKLAREVGFDGIELGAPNELDDKEVLAAQDATGLEIHGVVDSVHWRKPFSDPDPKVRAEGMDALKTAIDKAKLYGADTVLLVPAVVNKDVSYSFAYKQSQEEIRKALPYAEERGIKIALENVWNNFLLSPVEMVRYIDEFESPLVGAYFDCGNIVRYGWPVHWIEALGERIFKVHVKAYSREIQNKEGPRAGFRVEMGDGDIDWPSISNALVKAGYKSWVTSEVRGGDKARLVDVKQRMDNILKLA